MSLSVRTKLILLAALSILGIALLTVSSQLEMTSVYTAAAYANDNTVPSLLVLDDAQSAFVAQRVKFWQLLAQTDAAEVATLNREIQEARQTVETALKAYEPLISDDKDRAMLAADRATFATYYTLVDKALAMAGANRKTEARDLIMQNLDTVKAATAVIDAHRQYNKELGVQGTAEGIRVRGTARLIEIAIGV